jgi:hypothetical protein
MLTVPRSSIGVKLLDISAFAAATIAASAIAIVGAFAPFLIGASALATTTASLPIASAALGNEARRRSTRAQNGYACAMITKAFARPANVHVL